MRKLSCLTLFCFLSLSGCGHRPYLKDESGSYPSYKRFTASPVVVGENRLVPNLAFSYRFDSLESRHYYSMMAWTKIDDTSLPKSNNDDTLSQSMNPETLTLDSICITTRNSDTELCLGMHWDSLGSPLDSETTTRLFVSDSLLVSDNTEPISGRVIFTISAGDTDTSVARMARDFSFIYNSPPLFAYEQQSPETYPNPFSPRLDRPPTP